MIALGIFIFFAGDDMWYMFSEDLRNYNACIYSVNHVGHSNKYSSVVLLLSTTIRGSLRIYQRLILNQLCFYISI